MLKSMTAYGRASLSKALGHFTLEIQSVNRKFLDIQVQLPKELSQFDIDLKKWLMPHVARGQVSIKVNVTFEGSVPFVIRPNLLLARQLKDSWEEIAKELQLGEAAFQLSFLANVEGVLSFEENHNEEENYRQALQEVFEAALIPFLEMKHREGSYLQTEMQQRLAEIENWIRKIEEKAPFAPNKYREKLIQRLQELSFEIIENEERVLKEVALFAEKIDITEEISRFSCHLSHFRDLIESPELSVGKKIEFVLQELNREVNTIGSKSSDLEIARAVIDIKSELEKIREQIQNVE